MLQDSRGFMWIGTDGTGLNKYDGNEFTVFKTEPANQYSLSNNFIEDIIEDAKGTIWLSVGGNLNRYDKDKNRFIQYEYDNKYPSGIPAGSITCLATDHEGNLWMGTDANGLICLDITRNRFTRFMHKTGQNNATIKDIFEDSRHNLWIGTSEGLRIFDNIEKIIKRVSFNEKSHPPSDEDVKSIFEDSRHRLWVGTRGNGAYYTDLDTGEFHRFLSDKPIDIVFEINEDNDGNIWMGTENDGVIIFNPVSKTFRQYQHDDFDNSSLSNNSISFIKKDRYGNMWIGNFEGGVNILTRDSYTFTHYKHTSAENSLANNRVLCLFEDSRNRIWIGMDGGGLDMFNAITKKFTHFKHIEGNKNSICGNSVLSVCEDDLGNIWIGTWDKGITLFNPQKNTYRHFKHHKSDTSGLSSNYIWTLFKDRDKNIWVGNFDNGLNLYNADNGSFIRNAKNSGLPFAINHPAVRIIFEDSKRNLWIGTDGGISVFNRKTGQYTYYTMGSGSNSISNDMIRCIYEDKKGNFWIGTMGGLNHLDATTKIFTVYTTANGLPDDKIFAIQEDSKGNLWISSDKGLSCFNPLTKKIRNYTTADGLQSYEFKENAFCKSRTGTMYFGGINGFNEFIPGSIQENVFDPPIAITGFQVFNKEVPIATDGKDDSPLKKDITETKSITLPYKSSVISFTFSSLSYAAPGKKQYSYMLEGFDKSWNNVGKKRTATYTNLDPGKYIFRVKGLDNQGNWSSGTATIQLIITPPFWLTWWFRAGIIFTLVGGSILIFRQRINRIKVQKRKLEMQVEVRTEQLAHSIQEEQKARIEAEEANRAKSIFLATMSHEIRTPMNGVIGMSSLLSHTSLTAEQLGYTETIQSCGENLLTVINDILDFSKIESGKMELEEKDFDLRTCIEEVLDIFAPKAAEADLDLVYQIDPNVPTQIIGDSIRLRQIFINLVGNAIKFTHQGEVFIRIFIVTNKKGHKVELGFEVRDTGIGIPSDKLDHLFKAFSQIDSSTTRKYGGTGLGLVICEKLIKLMGGHIKVESEPGKGSIFSFTICTTASLKPTHIYAHCNMAGMEGKQILVVDDNATNRNILQLQLQQWKMSPVMATSGSEALQILAESRSFDLVLTDMHMPVMDGLELAKAIRSQNANIPIMLLSSVGDDHCKKYPELFNSILMKPVKQNVLCKHILGHLRMPDKSASVKEDTNGQLSTEFAKKFPLQIMIAEDNHFNQVLAVTVLTKLGYTPQLAENGFEAMSLAAKKSYDIILMDVQMPVMDGLEATRMIRQSQTSRPVIIAMTANAMQGDKEECLNAGMDDYLSKPVKPEAIMRILKIWALKMKPLQDSPNPSFP